MTAIQADYTSCTMAVQYRASKYLEGIGDTGIGTDNHFGKVNLREVQRVCNTMVSDICRVYGCDDLEKLLPEALIKTNVVKAQMAEWLYTAIDPLNHCCLPLMSSARRTIENLQEEKICGQTTVIELQKKLINKKDDELGLVSQTVQKELKTYSSALQQSCSTALSPKNIATAVKTITKEEDRTKEVIVFGVEEETDADECVTTKVSGILEQLDEKPRITDSQDAGELDSVQPERVRRGPSFSVLRAQTLYIKF